MKLVAYLEVLSGGRVYRGRTAIESCNAKAPKEAARAMRAIAKNTGEKFRAEGAPKLISATVGGNRYDAELSDYEFYTDLHRTGVATSFIGLRSESVDHDGCTLYLAIEVEGTKKDLGELAKLLA